MSVDDRCRGSWMGRRDEGAHCWYVTEEHRSHPGLEIGHIFLPSFGSIDVCPKPALATRNPRPSALATENHTVHTQYDFHPRARARRSAAALLAVFVHEGPQGLLA